MLSAEELKALTDTVGKQATDKLNEIVKEQNAKADKLAAEILAHKGELIDMKTFNEFKAATDKVTAEFKGIAEKQGLTITELQTKMNTSHTGVIKSISQVLEEDKEELRTIYNNKHGVKTYMVELGKDGTYGMKPFDASKSTGANATTVIGGAVASISQALDAATLLRVGAGSPIYNQYRNTPWIFDLCNTVNASFTGSMPFAMWYDEQAKVGSSAATTEGTAKTLVQYVYTLNSDTYKKEAALIGFTEEFHMDFPQLESDIMNKGRIDVTNRVNTAILPRITAAATTYNTGASFTNGVAVENVNDFDVIAAMAAQASNATFGSQANAAVMSNFKKYRMGITKAVTNGNYMNPPDVIGDLAFIGNPAMGADDIMVGDMKQYNIILRGGLIVRVGYNGTDFAQNQYSVAVEQFYFDYISTIRKVAIVKGPDFATVKTAIS